MARQYRPRKYAKSEKIRQCSEIRQFKTNGIRRPEPTTRSDEKSWDIEWVA